MVNTTSVIRLFEALELRAEYDARIGTIRACLPAGKRVSGVTSGRLEAGSVFDAGRLQESLQEMERRRDALDDAIELASASHGVVFRGRRLTLGEAFELRGALSREIGSLQRRVVLAAEACHSAEPQGPADGGCPPCVRQLDEARRTYRALNRILWMATVQADVTVAEVG